VTAIHQLVAGFAKGDAISNEALVLRAIFRSWGCASEIFSERRTIAPEHRGDVRDIETAPPPCGPDDVALLHLSIGSPVNALFGSLHCRKALLYHNVTPPDYFRTLQPRTAFKLAEGLEQARALAGVPAVCLADSRFNAGELQRLGYGEVGVLPLILDFDALRLRPDRRILSAFNDSAANILFVGRCVPNKRIEDLLVAFAYFQRTVESRSRLIHVGSWANAERYYHLLLSMARDLQLADVHFAGAVPQAELNAYYRAARVFLCMSEHEGFCIPLIESLFHGVPVLAYAAAAVPDTLDGAGVLFRAKQFGAVAEMLGALARPGPLRSAVLAGQRERLDRFLRRDPQAELRALLGPLLR
jgi:glycosyltransferase involved in cell wall biosynthesis